MQIDIWSDIACPYCYVGKRHLEKALKDYPKRDQVTIVWHSFELNPVAPIKQELPLAELLSKKYQTTLEGAESMIDRMTEMASESDLSFNLRNSKPTNTFDAHRLIHLAKNEGLQDEAKERFLKAYMMDGEFLGDHTTLKRLMLEIGLSQDKIDALLNSDQYAKDVRLDEQSAHQMGCSGVPFFVFNQEFAVSGAQPVEVFKQVFDKLDELNTQGESISTGTSCSI